MNFPAGLFGSAWTYGAYVPFVLVLLWSLRTAPWKRLSDSGQWNVWLGTIVVLTLMWSMNAGIRPGLNMHLLGVTAFTLMFGPQLAILGLCVVLGAVTYNSGAIGHALGWFPFALNALVMAVFPAFLAHGILRVVERFLPANFFVYIFVGTFFAAALNTVATGLLATLLLAAAGVYPLDMLFSDYFPYYVLLGFAEAWLNGAALTLMVVYYPHWVGSFDDTKYILHK
jgi:uncharacterized membrane protein